MSIRGRRGPLCVPLTLLAIVALLAGAGVGSAVGATRPRAAGSAGAPLILLQPHRRAPLITTEPASEAVAAGSTARFTAAATAKPRASVAWQLSTTAGRSWKIIAGARATSYAFVASAAESGYRYRAVFTNSVGKRTSAAATLTVTSPPSAPAPSSPPPPSSSSSSAGAPPVTTNPANSASAPLVTTNPENESVYAGASASFTAAASGSPAPTVQWEISSDGGSSWSDITDATGNTYSFGATLGVSGSEYRAVFTNAAGSTPTSAATLTVTNAPQSAPQITAQPANQTVADGETASFSAAASGNPAPTVQWQVSSDGGNSWSAISDATATTYSFAASSSESGYEYRAVFTNSVTSANTQAATLTIAEQSTNWSGYVASGATFSSVSGSWIVPSLSCADGQTAYSAQWIGIDGDPSSTVEQDGTEADCIDGSAYYGAWYEMYGDRQDHSRYYDEVPLDGSDGPPPEACQPASESACPVSPGDAMSATVSVSGSAWTLSIADTTAGWTFSTTIASPTPTPQQLSAEWIVEAPEVGSSGSSLADFGSVTFTGASATAGTTSGPISDFSSVPIEMVSSSDGSTVLAAPGPLSSGGAGFSVNWYGSD